MLEAKLGTKEHPHLNKFDFAKEKKHLEICFIYMCLWSWYLKLKGRQKQHCICIMEAKPNFKRMTTTCKNKHMFIKATRALEHFKIKVWMWGLDRYKRSQKQHGYGFLRWVRHNAWAEKKQNAEDNKRKRDVEGQGHHCFKAWQHMMIPVDQWKVM